MRLTKDEIQILERLMYLVNVVVQNDLLEHVDSVQYDGADCDGYALGDDLKDALDDVSHITGIEVPEVEETEDDWDDDVDPDEEEDEDA